MRTYVFPADVEPWRIFEAVHKDELRHMPYTAEVSGGLSGAGLRKGCDAKLSGFPAVRVAAVRPSSL